MKVRNDTDSDRFIFGMGFAKGATVDVSSLSAEKQAHLAREFTTVTEAAPVVEVTGTEAIESALADSVPAMRPRRRVSRKS